jgi:hypothetical protein
MGFSALRVACGQCKMPMSEGYLCGGFTWMRYTRSQRGESPRSSFGILDNAFELGMSLKDSSRDVAI